MTWRSGGLICLILMTLVAPSLGRAEVPSAVREAGGVSLTGPGGQVVRWLGAQAPESVAAGQSFQLEVAFAADKPLPANSWIFVHVESSSSRCRVVRDAAAPAPSGGLLRHTLEITVPKSAVCSPQRMEVRAGVYLRGGGGRFRAEPGHSADDRLHVSYFELTGGGATGPARWTTAGDMALQRWVSASRPWWRWLSGVALALLLALGLRRLRLTAPQPMERRWLDRALGVAVGGLALWSIIVAIDFVKDDAYISFRYAHNVVEGQGLVFNSYDRLEGITNLLWTLVLVPFEAMGLDLFQVSEILGTLLIWWLLYAMTRITAACGGRSPLSAHLWPAIAMACSSTVTLWATSGMEQPLAMALPMVGAATLWRSWTELDSPKAHRDALLAGVWVGLGCLTRPDIHLIAAVLGLSLVARAALNRRLDRVLLGFALGGLLVTIPGHTFRYLYFGEWLPNTYYVKTGGGALVWLKGLQALHEMWDFNHIGLLALLAPLAFARRERLVEKLCLAAISTGYMAYIVKVGRDEMHWHRLYLPALPSLAILAGLGLQNLALALSRLVAARWNVAAAGALGWALVAGMVWSNGAYTWKHQHGWNGRGDLSGNYHPDIGKFVTRHSRPGALVAFQDMGSTPYHAPDLDFFDFIGLTDRVVARTRHRYGLHPFLDTSAQRHQGAFDAEMRRYFHKQQPEWVILTSYIHGADNMNRVAKRFEKRPTPASLGWSVGSNRYQFGVYNAEFKRKYQHVRTWPRSRGYYLSLFYLRDLWKKVPGESVFSGLPDGVGGVKAQLDRGVRLVGTSMPTEVVAKHELYLQLWWQVDGPLEDDWWVFVHVERPGYRHPADHIPGDWMWPADRWRKGDVISDRTLVQLPPFMAPGEYDVWVGMYRRSTWERLAVQSGPKDPQNRIHLGKIKVRAQRPLLDHLIRPTRVSEDRAYPDRIIDHGREAGAYAKRAAETKIAPASSPNP